MWLLALSLPLVVSIVACQGGDSAVTIISGGKSIRVQVEIANTEQLRELGLMYRRHLDRDAGMLFLFPAPSHLVFWMKNTLIPLDMIFIGQNRRIVGIVADAQPYSERRLGVDALAQYVLEVNAGFCKSHGIVSGDAVRFSDVGKAAGAP